MPITVVLLLVVVGALLVTMTGALLAFVVLHNPATVGTAMMAAIGPPSALIWLVASLAASAGLLLGWLARGMSVAPQAISGSSPPGAARSGLFAGFGPGAPLVVIGLVFALCLALALAGVALDQTTVPRALLLTIFVTAAFAATLTMVDALRDDPLELQSSWGGLGGGLGGWRLSRSAVLLLVAAAFAGAAVMVATPPAKTEVRPKEAATAGRNLTLTLSLSAPAAHAGTTPPPGHE